MDCFHSGLRRARTQSSLRQLDLRYRLTVALASWRGQGVDEHHVGCTKRAYGRRCACGLATVPNAYTGRVSKNLDPRGQLSETQPTRSPSLTRRCANGLRGMRSRVCLATRSPARSRQSGGSLGDPD